MTQAIATTEVEAPVDLIAPAEKKSPAELFRPNGLDDIIAQITAQAKSLVPDISTEKGRKAIATMARKVSSSKVYLDDMGKNLVADKKLEIAKVDAERKRMRDILEKLRDDTRQPLTDFEDKEVARIKGHELALAEIEHMGGHAFPASVGALNQTVQAIEAYSDRDWQEFAARYAAVSALALERLTGEIEKANRHEQEQAELTRLRQAEAERQQAEREQRLAAEAEERAKHAAEEALRAERAASERIQREAEQKVRDAEAAAERAAQQAAYAVEQEQRRVAAEKAQQEAEDAKREANKRHRAKIHREIVAALVAHVPEDIAKTIVVAIAKGEVPHVKVAY